MNMSIEEHEKALGRWPRRLLRISDLTSFEWQPGNIYGGVKEPPYNAISYTWGRWRLKDGVKPEIDPLPIKNVPWEKFLPRIDPSHFTMQQFLAALHAAVSTPTEDNYPPVEFIWLDVACIDQRAGEPSSDAEIGRQGLIFRGAQAVFIWLTTMTSSENYQVFGEIDWWFTPPAEHTSETIKPITDILVTFLDVLKDPWFSSLWTLQEAFLRPDSVVLTQSGETVTYYLYGEANSLTLRHLLVWGVNSDGFCTQRAALNRGEGIFASLKRLIEERGLVALRASNNMAILGAAMYRKATILTDRVYGIQQVFDLRLGKTSIDAHKNPSPSLSELEDQLGEALLAKEPMLSQSHVFMRPVPFQNRWRINSCSSVPISLYNFTSSQLRRRDEASGHLSSTRRPVEVKCSLWVDRSQSGPKPVRWRGPILLLDTFLGLLRQDMDNSGKETTLHVFPDFTEEFLVSPDYQNPSFPDPISRGEVSDNFARRLVQTYAPNSIWLLLLGISPTEHDGGCVLSLMLCEKPNGNFERLGLCQWWLPDAASAERPQFEGISHDWKFEEGIFGYIR